MASQYLKIGKINYANTFPIFYTLENECECSYYKFIEGVPSALNRLLWEGKIDISPSSSIEYLRHEDGYNILDGHSISSSGPIGSILLFSKLPIEALDGLTILTSSQSETSSALLDIILKKFYNLKCKLKAVNEPLLRALESYPAYLLIGDDALVAKKEVRTFDSGSQILGLKRKDKETLIRNLQSELYAYDLGDIWFKNTGLPFVFALWIARKDRCSELPVLFERFKKDIDVSKAKSLKNLQNIARESPLINIFSEDELVSYWQGISYDLNAEHKNGLELFRKYAAELKLI